MNDLEYLIKKCVRKLGVERMGVYAHEIDFILNIDRHISLGKKLTERQRIKLAVLVPKILAAPRAFKKITLR